MDSYKFNLLHNKQLFIDQLKNNNNLGKRTIDEKYGRKIGDVLRVCGFFQEIPTCWTKPKLKNKLPDWKVKSSHLTVQKYSAKYKLDDYKAELDKAPISFDRMSLDWNQICKNAYKNVPDGSVANPVLVDGLQANPDVKQVVQSSINLLKKPHRGVSMKEIGTLVSAFE